MVSFIEGRWNVLFFGIRLCMRLILSKQFFAREISCLNLHFDEHLDRLSSTYVERRRILLPFYDQRF